MELLIYLRFLLKSWLWLAIGAVIGGVVVGSVAYTTADAYRATVAIYVKRAPDAANDNYFTYEGYYAQQTAAAYTDTAMELLTNDEIVKRAAASAGMANDVASVSEIKGSTITKKDAPQLIRLEVTMPTKEKASRLAEGLSQALKSRTSELQSAGGDTQLGVEQINDRPLVVLVRPLLWLYVLIGSILGLIGGGLLAAVWWYARNYRRT